MSQTDRGENHISLTTSGDNAIADARSILSSFDLDEKTVSEVSIDIAYAEADDAASADASPRTDSDIPGRVRPGTAEETVLLGIYGEFQDGWFLMNEAADRISADGNVRSTISRLERRKNLLERRRSESDGAKFDYRLSTAGLQESERLMDDG